MIDVSIEKMQPSEIDVVANILMEAFIVNSAYKLVFLNDNQREEGLLWLFKSNLIIHNQKQTLTRVVKVKGTNEIIGTFTIVPPEGIGNNWAVYCKLGLFGFVSKFGFTPLIRMKGLDRCNKSTLDQSIQAKEYYYLSTLVIKKEYQGSGLGSYVVRQVIRELSRNPKATIMGLTTQLAVNATFYTKLGFKKLDEGYVNYKQHRYYNYNMAIDLPQAYPSDVD